MRGYNLVRENGCFGCHEIAGMKGGRSIGPDLRLEPTPPLDAYTPAEKAKLLADALNPPGGMRKVGPSLRRISEKTNADWMRLWVKSPRTFRPDTKMPHYYQLSNNMPDVLPEDQKKFPDAEINSIVTYLLTESGSYLKGTDKFRLANQARLAELDDKEKRGLASDKEKREAEELKRRLELFSVPTPLAKLLPDLPDEPKDAKAKEEQLKHGRQLFSERGCLACHINEATAKPGNGLPAISGDGHFGPNLSRIAAKLGSGTKDSARRWLVQWIMNPTIHNPRTSMPITHLGLEDANDVAVWLLSQKADWPDPEEKKLATDDTRPAEDRDPQEPGQGLPGPRLFAPADRGISEERLPRRGTQGHEARSGGTRAGGPARRAQAENVHRQEGHRPAGLLRLPRCSRLRVRQTDRHAAERLGQEGPRAAGLRGCLRLRPQTPLFREPLHGQGRQAPRPRQRRQGTLRQVLLRIAAAPRARRFPEPEADRAA